MIRLLIILALFSCKKEYLAQKCYCETYTIRLVQTESCLRQDTVSISYSDDCSLNDTGYMENGIIVNTKCKKR